jgi:hypothetical protein
MNTEWNTDMNIERALYEFLQRVRAGHGDVMDCDSWLERLDELQVDFDVFEDAWNETN